MHLKSFVKILVGSFCVLLAFPLWLLVAVVKYLVRRMKSKSKPKLVWGPVPVINNKYWSNAMNQAGYNSITLMSGYYSFMHGKSTFDRYTNELIPLLSRISNKMFRRFYSLFLPYISFTHSLWYYDIFHHHFNGGFLGQSPFWWLESYFLRLAGSKTVINAYGSDFYRYSHILDISWRHSLLMNRDAEYSKEEMTITKKVNYWVKRADVIIAGFHVDGIGRWDVLPFTMITIDCKAWKQKEAHTDNDGSNGLVQIIHTPNHRGPKGTEFVIKAVEELKAEGLKIELILLERMPNEMVKEKMFEADILVEQLIRSYAMTAIEGMASGLPVLANLDNEDYTRVFRRYSYLNECPILSTTPENVKSNLKTLITNPQLRKELGRAGRQYAEKYHSEQTAQYTFGKIYDKIWYEKEADLINLFDPVIGEYNKSQPQIKHPLVENKLPSDYLS